MVAWFCVKKKERMGRNPKTKEEYKISKRYAITFYPSKNLKQSIKGYLIKCFTSHSLFMKKAFNFGCKMNDIRQSTVA